MRRRNKNQQKIISDMNVVPYIDVMLVLLIIFMVTAPMMTKELKLSYQQQHLKILILIHIIYL